MANNQTIDSLNLDIKVSGLKQSDINKLEKLSNSLIVLDKSLTTSLINKLKSLSTPLSKLGSVGNISKIFKGFTSDKAQGIQATSKALSSLDKVVTNSFVNRLQKLAQINLGFKNLSGLQTFLKEYNTQTIDTQQETTTIEEPKAEVKEQDTKKKGSSLIGILNQIGNLGSNVFEKLGKKFNKTFKAIGRVALYRAIRTAIAGITNAVKVGIQNLAQYDTNVNEAMSSIATSTKNIQNSIGLMMQPFIESIAPLLEQISQIFINIGNEISRINALTQGNATYTKINADYAKDYANSMAKASGFAFDTFNVLSSGNGDMYETASTESSEKEGNFFENTIASSLVNISNIATEVFNILSGAIKGFIVTLSPVIWLATTIIEGVTWLLSNIPYLSEVLGALSAVILLINIAMNANPLSLWIIGITALVGLIGIAVRAIVTNWENIINWFRSGWNILKGFVQGIINTIKNAFTTIGKGIANFYIGIFNFVMTTIEGVANFIIDIINYLLSLINKIGSAFGKDWNLEINQVSLPKVDYYANGGIASSGSLFVAGESGAELLTNMGGGNTGITNVEQFETAMTRAIISSGLLQAVEESANIYLDNEKVGGKIGQSISLRRQINRTNPNLKLR